MSDSPQGRGTDGETLDDALQEISQARHELNNHLTPALAEVQLLLMDVESEELRESYEVIQESLRGIRSCVASIAHLRARSTDRG